MAYFSDEQILLTSLVNTSFLMFKGFFLKSHFKLFIKSLIKNF